MYDDYERCSIDTYVHIDVEAKPCAGQMMEIFEWIDELMLPTNSIPREHSSKCNDDGEIEGMNYAYKKIDMNSFNEKYFMEYIMDIEGELWYNFDDQEYDGDPTTLSVDDYITWYTKLRKGEWYLVIGVCYTANDYTAEDYRDMYADMECHRRRDEGEEE